MANRRFHPHALLPLPAASVPQIIANRRQFRCGPPVSLLEQIRITTHKRDLPYQSLIKMRLTEKVDSPRHRVPTSHPLPLDLRYVMVESPRPARPIMPDFHAIITHQLALIDATNAGERHAVYGRVKDVLHRAIEKTQDRASLLDALYELDRIIDDIERGYTQSPSRLDRLLKPIRNLSTEAKLKYGAIAGLISTVADFVKPLLELTVPIIVSSAIGGIVLLLGSSLAKTSRPLLQSGAFLCGLLFLFSSGWWGLQHFVRDADANGAFAEIIPGASTVQDAFLARLGRIEEQTRRVGDLLEENARQTAEEARESAAMDKEFRRQEREKENLARERIRIAGYHADAGGFVRAYMGNADVKDAFDTLRIEPTEAAVRAVAPTVQTTKEMLELSSLVRDRANRLPDLQKLKHSLDLDGAKIAAAFQEANAQATVCNPQNYSLLIGSDLLKKACAENGRRFANAFEDYFTAAYATTNLTSLDFMRKAPSSLPVEKVAGTLWPGEIKDCRYYAGELDYFHIGGLFSWGTIGTRNSARIVYVYSEDPQFGQDSEKRCPKVDVEAGRARFCRARVIVATSCKATSLPSLRIVKNLASLR